MFIQAPVSKDAGAFFGSVANAGVEKNLFFCIEGIFVFVTKYNMKEICCEERDYVQA